MKLNFSVVLFLSTLSKLAEFPRIVAPPTSRLQIPVLRLSLAVSFKKLYCSGPTPGSVAWLDGVLRVLGLKTCCAYSLKLFAVADFSLWTAPSSTKQLARGTQELGLLRSSRQTRSLLTPNQMPPNFRIRSIHLYSHLGSGTR